ncbi:MAG: RluA family pseudouridine synthase [Pirellulales bacterium]|nr:RluA family pseudouridine synthase [Pirellulales bacterium]
MHTHPFPILFEDNHVLVVNKPAGLATMGVAANKPSVLSEAKKYIAAKYNKPGNVYLGVVSRLDAPVTGALVIARTSKSASRLSAQFRDPGLVEKIYWAAVTGRPSPEEGALRDWVIKDERHRRMHIANRKQSGAQEARLTYRALRHDMANSLVEVKLQTGRKHQIRLQLGSRGWPVVGDRKYGSNQSFPVGIALHSRRISFEHPVRREPIEIIAELPKCWRDLGIGSQGLSH